MESTLVILAGGGSRRFQLGDSGSVDKCLFPFNGEPMIMRIIRQATIFNNVVIAAGVNYEKYVKLGLRVIKDSERLRGVLAGVDSASTLGGVLVFSPCDTPNVTVDVFKALMDNGPLSVFVMPNGLVETHLFRVDSDLLRGIMDIIANHGRERLSDVFRLSSTVKFLSPLSHGLRLTYFLNVNRRSDLMGFNLSGPIVFTSDKELNWREPPLLRVLNGMSDPEEELWSEVKVYVREGIMTLAAHALKDLEHLSRGFGAVANMILNSIGVEK
jgi:molybdopterin-guanine dinucleotide biosynthesis protein A